MLPYICSNILRYSGALLWAPYLEKNIVFRDEIWWMNVDERRICIGIYRPKDACMGRARSLEPGPQPRTAAPRPGTEAETGTGRGTTTGSSWLGL